MDNLNSKTEMDYACIINSFTSQIDKIKKIINIGDKSLHNDQ